MFEIVTNIHMHTRYSDGAGSHRDIAEAAIKAGIDAVIVTDHNVLVKGMERYYTNKFGQVLVLVGEEVHDQDRAPQKNHLLVIGGRQEFAQYADNPQILIDRVMEHKGLTFIAHPYDPAVPKFNQEDLSWVDWNVRGYTGIELWNSLSELKKYLTSYPNAIYHVYNPAETPEGPFVESVKLWDRLLSGGDKVVAIGGSDAHALTVTLGPLKRVVFPYEFHFNCINTHLLSPNPLSGGLEEDRQTILNAMRKGRAFIGNDLPAPTRGFRFSAQGKDQTAIMGEDIHLGDGVTLQIRLPQKAECRLLRNGDVIKTWDNRETCTYITSQPGVYRVEVFVSYRRKLRHWIISNPIYVREKSPTNHPGKQT